MARKIRPNPSSPQQRSIITNSPHRLPGVDMRSPAGRRFRDIVDATIAEFGSSNKEAIRELAGLKLTLEKTQAAFFAGDARARDDLVRIGRLIDRKEATLRTRAAATNRPMTIQEYLASRYESDDDEE